MALRGLPFVGTWYSDLNGAVQLTAYPTHGLPDHLDLSRVEAARFRLPISRLQLGSLEGIEPRDVLDLFHRSPSELCFLRVPAGSERWTADLIGDDVTALPADFLIYFGRPLDDVVAERARWLAGRQDEDELVASVRSTFADYSNHYRSNPLLAAQDCEEGYVEWCASHLHTDDAAVALLRSEDGSISAFGAVTVAGTTGEIALAGVSPDHRGRGVYDDLLATLEHQVREMGADEIVISTQGWNTAPMRAWSRRAYRPLSAFSTLHLFRGDCRRQLLAIADERRSLR